MNAALTELIISQAKTFAVMMAAGILVESLWQIKKRAPWKIPAEGVFWVLAAMVISAFLYYAAFGRITLHAAAGFFAGLLLWKKCCCAIMNPRD